MAGEYTEITITAPSSAEAGAIVDVAVAVKNIVDLTIYVIPVLSINGEVEATGSYETITKGKTHSWLFSVVMPSGSIVVAITGWLETYQVDWHADYSVEHNILLAAPSNGEEPPNGNGEVPPGTIELGGVINLMVVMMMMAMMMKTMNKMGEPKPLYPSGKPLYPGGPPPGQFLRAK